MSASKPKTRSRFPAWLGAVLAVAACAALGYLARAAWAERPGAALAGAAIPARPDLSGRPAKLVELVAAAEAKARDRHRASEGFAELGRIYHVNGALAQAEACWEILAAAEPREARWPYFESDVSRRQSNYPAMKAALARTVELAPDYVPARLRLADLQFKTGETAAAQQNYSARLQRLPQDPYARLGLARIALQQGKTAEARSTLEDLVRDTPQFSAGHNLLAEILASAGDAEGASRHRWMGRETGRFREAEDPWLEEMNAYCYDNKRLCVLGTVESQTEHPEKAEAYFQRAIECQPDDLSAYELLAVVWLKEGRAEEARKLLTAGLQRPAHSRPSPMYYVNLSQAQRELKHPAEAVQAARDGLAETPGVYELYDALGIALGEAGDYPAAIAAQEKALALNANDPNANYNLALCLLAVGREDDAVAALKQSLVLQPTFPKSLLVLGRRELEAGRWEEAERYLRPLFESHPEMPEVRQLVARWRFAAGRAAEDRKDLAAAEKFYRSGLAVDGNNPDLNAGLGTLYLVQHRIPEAVPFLEAYHRVLPREPRANLFLGQVYAMTGRLDDARRLLAEGASLAEETGNPGTARDCREILASLPPSR